MKCLFILLASGCLLTACATPQEPQVRVVEKAVPTPVPCINENLGPAPAYPDTDAALKAAPSPAQRYGLIAAGRELRIYRLDELEAVVGACRILAPPPA